MFNNPLLLALCGALLSSAVGYFVNQLPAIKQFPGKNALVLKLTVEIVILLGIYGFWNTPEIKSHQLQVVLAWVGGLTSLLFIWHTFKLIWMLVKTKTDNSIDNTTKELKSTADWRRELLKVMKIDVENRLNDSLYDGKIIRVGTEDRETAVGRNSVNASIINKQASLINKILQPLRSLEVFGGRKTELAAGKPIIEVFEESDIAGRLLILGNPGAGKTTLLLELARDLITKAQENPTVAIPVLFELTNWRDDKQNIANWLEADLKFRYNIPEKITREWLSTEKIVPLLDGLDELGLTRQRKCIDKINEFLQNHSSLLQLVVCCREEEYQQGELILNKLRGAVCLQSLSERQIQAYLRELSCQNLWEGIKNDVDGLGELAKTPLFLNLIPIAYPDGLVSKGKRFNSEDERKEYQDKCRKELFDKYIERKLGEHHDRKGYKVEDVKRWLVWLAKKMEQYKLKEFYIEGMQPSYLKSRRGKILYSFISGLIIGLITGLIILPDMGIVYGVMSGIIIGLICGITQHKIKTVETFKIGFNFDSFVMYMPIGLFFGIIHGIYYGRNNGLQYPIMYGIINGILVGLFIGLMFGLIDGLNGKELIHKNHANQGIQKSVKNTVIFTLIIFLAIFILFILPFLPLAKSSILSVILLSLYFGIWFAGLPVIQHFSLRLILWKNRSIPWNYARFLKYADERKLINQVGGRFTFIHDKLQEHFARM